MFKSFWFSTNFKLSFERSSTIWENWLLCRIQMDPCGNGWGKLTLRQTVPHLQLSSSEYLTLYLSWYSEPFFSRLQKVFSALGWKYYLMLTINFCILPIYFCTHEDLEQNPIVLLNSLLMCLKICETFFWDYYVEIITIFLQGCENCRVHSKIFASTSRHFLKDMDKTHLKNAHNI